jgi:hypothetical protein
MTRAHDKAKAKKRRKWNGNFSASNSFSQSTQPKTNATNTTFLYFYHLDEKFKEFSPDQNACFDHFRKHFKALCKFENNPQNLSLALCKLVSHTQNFGMSPFAIHSVLNYVQEHLLDWENALRVHLDDLNAHDISQIWGCYSRLARPLPDDIKEAGLKHRDDFRHTVRIGEDGAGMSIVWCASVQYVLTEDPDYIDFASQLCHEMQSHLDGKPIPFVRQICQSNILFDLGMTIDVQT